MRAVVSVAKGMRLDVLTDEQTEDEPRHIDDQEGDDGENEEERFASGRHYLRAPGLDVFGTILDAFVPFCLSLNKRKLFTL